LPVKDWLEALPEPYRTQAAINYAKNERERPEYIPLPVTSVKAALMAAFDWDNTPEGKAYWTSFYFKRLT
jgi:hypothetical protein